MTAAIGQVRKKCPLNFTEQSSRTAKMRHSKSDSPYSQNKNRATPRVQMTGRHGVNDMLARTKSITHRKKWKNSLRGHERKGNKELTVTIRSVERASFYQKKTMEIWNKQNRACGSERVRSVDPSNQSKVQQRGISVACTVFPQTQHLS